MRAIWKGSISFGLVNIPIGLFPATRKEEISFRQLREEDLSPIRYKRVAEVDGEEVPWEKIVKGYEHSKGEFVIVSDEDFEKAMPEALRVIVQPQDQVMLMNGQISNGLKSQLISLVNPNESSRLPASKPGPS